MKELINILSENKIKVVKLNKYNPELTLGKGCFTKMKPTIIDKLTIIGLEVESFENQTSEFDDFIVAKIVNAEKHPNADRLRLCEVDIGKSETVKVVCGAPNAKNNLHTVYAPPGTIIPKNQMKLSVSKIRGVTSYGMLCSESELNISNESEGIIDLNAKKYRNQIGKKYFKNSDPKVLDL